ncbi:hypothetical protein BS333_05440 [Vibrio azureus]|uniref:Restriction endonuclease n=1 Tax=Vibrio azureus NBRC 104587 TaxID=1219077 RepID=U3ATN6_9VIBR|nr:hypothetical protein [Vibrio azureus]AUI85866.1 hypothetical protein BS333_05440 [Vibrio azureus]GAD77120.1 hypothetical protein VAZ01S_062_00230 [Vibrio azureus NBRC 104587]
MNQSVVNPYLSGDDQVSKKYREMLYSCLDILDDYATPTQLRKLKKELQLGGSTFNEAKFLQAACETSVAASIASSFPQTFVYEPKLNPPSDVDCSFSYNGFKFNIEVKCPDFTKAHAQQERNTFNIGAFGRMPEFKDTAKMLSDLFESKGNAFEVQPHMDNKLKDYLLSAQKKFSSEVKSKELNVLLVCCDTAMDMQKWFHYMYGMQGLLTPESFYNPLEYERVDVVILTNLYHRHYSYKDKLKIEDHWSFGKAFNLIFKNRSLNKGKDEVIWALVDTIPNFSREIVDYLSSLQEIEKHFAIPMFVRSKLNADKQCYFEPKT